MGEGDVILIVDDDLTLMEMYQERLKQEGYVVMGALNGEEALEKAKKDKPSLILLDIMMPKMNGIDVMKQLRADSQTKDIPVIVLTALIQEVDKIKDLMSDKDGYMIKSESMPKDVLDKVKASLEDV